MSCQSLWDIDDFTPCAKHLFIEEYLLGGFMAASVVLLLGETVALATSKFKNGLFKYKITTSSGDEQQPLLGDSGEAGPEYLTIQDTEDDDGDDTDGKGGDAKNKSPSDIHFDVTHIKPVDADGKPISKLQIVYRTQAERRKVAFEELLVILHLGLQALIFFSPEIGQEWSLYQTTPYIGLAYWIYMLVLCTIRLTYVSTGLSQKLPDLWYFTFSLYLLDWFPSVFLLRSAVLHHTATDQSRLFYIAQFVLDTALILLVGSCHFSDRPAIRAIQDGIEPSPEMETSFFSIVFYAWIDKMIFIAHKTGIQMSDIWGLRYDDYAYPVLMKYHKSKYYVKFTYNLFSQFTGYLLQQSCLTTVDALVTFVPAILLKYLLEYIEDPSSGTSSMAWLYVILMFVANAVCAFFNGRSLYVGRRVSTRMRAIIVGEIYAKALRRKLTADNDPDDEAEKDLSEEGAEHSEGEPPHEKREKDPSSTKSKDIGTIINLMAVDAFRVSEICAYLHYFVSSIVMTVFAITLLYNLMGWPALVGSLTIIFLLPINYSISLKLGDYQKRMLKVTDERIQKLNETFQNIRIIKFFAWESKFEEDIMDIRIRELDYLKMRCIVWIGVTFLWMITPTLVCLVTFYCYTVVLNRPLTTPVAFTALSLFNLLRNPLDQLADMLSFVVQSKISLDRIQEFLNEPECSKYEQLSLKRGPNSPLVGFENATFSWSKDSKNDFQLRDLDISFKVGKLNLIIGPTGSGKSSILLALLGEMELKKGKVFLPGSTPREDLVPNPVTGLTESVAYCSQTPWLLNGTVKDNILFSSPYDEERYTAVIAACGLARDLEILEGGDSTEVGEKGVTLSGGQKQRVSLARALYSTASYVLLDDCLSAVDSHTAVHVYQECITGKLMKNRTCILVSHNISLTVREAAWVVSMENGRVKTQGSVEQLIDEKEFDKETVSSALASRTPSTTALDKLDDEDDGFNYETHEELLDAATRVLSRKNTVFPESEINADEFEHTAGKLVEDETKSEGAVSWKVYKAYLSYFGSPTLWTMMMATYVGSQAIYAVQAWWLRIWAAQASQIVHDIVIYSANYAIGAFRSVDWSKPLIKTAVGERIFGSEEVIHSTMYYIGIYALIGLAYAMVGCASSILTFYGGLRVSNRMFSDLLHRVVRSSLRFFDSTPVGRIMNRFSKDIEGVDQELAPYMESFVVSVVSCVVTIVVITIITPLFLVVAVILCYLYALVGIYYLDLSRDLKRFESITRSPIHQHFTETLVGVTTIRAYCDESRFLIDNMLRIDGNNRPFFYVWLNNRWLALRADFIGALVTVVSGSLAVAASRRIDSGMAGISLSFAVSFSNAALWTMRTYSQVEINMNSIERIQEYVTGTPQEPEAHTKHDPPSSWPQRGEIDVHDLSIRYAPELPRVIKNVSFHVNPAEKVGVIGRTGAGKSTIIQSFFRFVDPDSGFIKIDGSDITKIGLTPLRRGLTIIPQDPTLFAGTLRSNLDIYGDYLDKDMFESLRRVGLVSKEELAELANPLTRATAGNDEENKNKFLDLDAPITEGGGNLSQGERQLLCLARSLLKSPKILMLDEATASIDYESDAKLQKTIREEFSTSTIITIAHRLKTIIDYDRILVLDQGQVKEYEHPYVLLKDKKSQFRSMCEDTGEFDELMRLAKEAYAKVSKK